MVFSGLESVDQNILCFCTVVLSADQIDFLIFSIPCLPAGRTVTPLPCRRNGGSTTDPSILKIGADRFFRNNLIFAIQLFAGGHHVDR
jgi:hypothetical protein